MRLWMILGRLDSSLCYCITGPVWKQYLENDTTIIAWICQINLFFTLGILLVAKDVTYVGGFVVTIGVFVSGVATNIYRTELKRIRDYRSLLCKYIILGSLWRVKRVWIGKDLATFLKKLASSLLMWHFLSALGTISGSFDVFLQYICVSRWCWQLYKEQ